MIITFLGTGTSQGVPPIGVNDEVARSLDFRDKRMRTAVHLQIDDKSIVIDTGPDFRRQVLDNRIPTLDAILYTHEHRDHTSGLDEVRSFNFKQGKDIPLYARQEVIERLEEEFSYIFENDYPGLPRVRVHPITNEPFKAAGIPFTPIDVLHGKMPVFGFRTGDFTYITDTNYIPDEEKPKIRGSEVLVLDALQYEPHYSHFTLSQALHFIEEIKPKNAYLIHMSHKLGLHADVEAILPENVHLAYDGLQLKL